MSLTDRSLAFFPTRMTTSTSPISIHVLPLFSFELGVPVLTLPSRPESRPGADGSGGSHGLPVNDVPPGLGKGLLTRDAVVAQPGVLPGVEAQEGHEVEAAGWLGAELLGALAAADEAGGGAVVADGVHVAALQAPVRARVGAAGEVGGEDAVLVGGRP